jgi:hypothetical protein
MKDAKFDSEGKNIVRAEVRKRYIEKGGGLGFYGTGKGYKEAKREFPQGDFLFIDDARDGTVTSIKKLKKEFKDNPELMIISLHNLAKTTYKTGVVFADGCGPYGYKSTTQTIIDSLKILTPEGYIYLTFQKRRERGFITKGESRKRINNDILELIGQTFKNLECKFEVVFNHEYKSNCRGTPMQTIGFHCQQRQFRFF